MPVGSPPILTVDRRSSSVGASLGPAAPTAGGSPLRRTLTDMTGRNYVFPEPDDDLVSIAARELPGVEGGEQQLLSWNLHLAARAGLGRAGGLLPSDVVFTEPPPAR